MPLPECIQIVEVYILIPGKVPEERGTSGDIVCGKTKADSADDELYVPHGSLYQETVHDVTDVRIGDDGYWPLCVVHDPNAVQPFLHSKMGCCQFKRERRHHTTWTAQW